MRKREIPVSSEKVLPDQKVLSQHNGIKGTIPRLKERVNTLDTITIKLWNNGYTFRVDVQPQETVREIKEKVKDRVRSSKGDQLMLKTEDGRELRDYMTLLDYGIEQYETLELKIEKAHGSYRGVRKRRRRAGRSRMNDDVRSRGDRERNWRRERKYFNRD